MQVRDAVEADAETLARMSGTPTDAMVNMIHDRTVRVAVDEDVTSGADPAGSEADDPADGVEEDPADGADGIPTDGDPDVREADADAIAGFVSFDAHVNTVHVTQLAGSDAGVCGRLLDEPVSFARGEGMAVELLVPTDDDSLAAAAEQAGFEDAGMGPRFDTHPTVKFRLEPNMN